MLELNTDQGPGEGLYFVTGSLFYIDKYAHAQLNIIKFG